MHDIEMHSLSDGAGETLADSWGDRPVEACLTPGKHVGTKTEHRKGRPSVAITKLPGIVACNGALVVASESSNPEAILTLKLKTESGDQVLLPLSERTTGQLQHVISEFNRTRDLLFMEGRPSASATLQ